IGFETVTNIRDELTLTTRWPLLAAAVVITVAGRFLYAIAVDPWLARRMDRQFRHPDSDLHDARLGTEHRGRASRIARSRLCRFLRGRRLLVRAPCQE